MKKQEEDKSLGTAFCNRSPDVATPTQTLMGSMLVSVRYRVRLRMDDYEAIEEAEVEELVMEVYNNIGAEEMEEIYIRQESDEEEGYIGDEEEVEETGVEAIYISQGESDEEEGNIGEEEEEVEETEVEVIYIRQEESNEEEGYIGDEEEEVEETAVEAIYISEEEVPEMKEEINSKEEEEEEMAMWWRRVAMSDQPVRIRTVMKLTPFTLDTIEEEQTPQEEEEQTPQEEEEQTPQEEEEQVVAEVEEVSPRRPLGQEVMEAGASEESPLPRRRWWRPKCLQNSSSKKSRSSSRGERRPSRFLRFLLCCISIDTVE
ncbi:uncharacterized protein [Engystomops pustulosus]|uniref:uncharacterized protein n=1 Tax=Engystomops pustulosus TaxID=76066 RepID=UPI003AFADCE3